MKIVVAYSRRRNAKLDDGRVGGGGGEFILVGVFGAERCKQANVIG